MTQSFEKVDTIDLNKTRRATTIGPVAGRPFPVCDTSATIRRGDWNYSVMLIQWRNVYLWELLVKKWMALATLIFFYLVTVSILNNCAMKNNGWKRWIWFYEPTCTSRSAVLRHSPPCLASMYVSEHRLMSAIYELKNQGKLVKLSEHNKPM